MNRPAVFAVERLDMTLGPERWPFADARRAEIDVFFAALRREKPAVWNGRVLMLGRHELADGVLRGRWLETDFASMLAWKAWDGPDPSVRNGFALGALRGADGAFLLGVMAHHTANAGRVYFPAGTPDLDDVTGETVDLAGSVLREVAEETGLTVSDFAMAPGWIAVESRMQLALVRLLQAREDAETLRARILRHLASERNPELADIRVVRGPDDLDAMMPAFITAYLRHIWR